MNGLEVASKGFKMNEAVSDFASDKTNMNSITQSIFI
jgi:hypothetical protein